MALKDQVAKTQAELDSEKAQTLPATKVVLPGPARSYGSSTASFDQSTGFVSLTDSINQTFRPMWRTPDAAVQQNKVITTKLPDATIGKGLIQSPSVTSASLVAIPDVAVALNIPGHSGDPNREGGTVQLSWHVSAALSVATAQASFALFRDNQQIGPTVYGSNPNNNGKFSVAQTFIDTPGSGLHAYAVYWATSAGTLTADGIGRYIHALPLRPQ